MHSGYGIEYKTAVAAAATAGSALWTAYSDNRDVASHYRRDIDDINVNISTLTAGVVTVGWGDDGTTKPLLKASALGSYPLSFKGTGVPGVTGSSIGYSITGSGVNVSIEVGSHLVKVATSD